MAAMLRLYQTMAEMEPETKRTLLSAAALCATFIVILISFCWVLNKRKSEEKPRSATWLVRELNVLGCNILTLTLTPTLTRTLTLTDPDPNSAPVHSRLCIGVQSAV